MRFNPRRLLALAAIALASAASVASLDEGAPPNATVTAALPARSVLLSDASPVLVVLHIAASVPIGLIALRLDATATWPGFVESDAGTPADFPILRATLGHSGLDAGAGGLDADAGALDVGVVLERAITMNPGAGDLVIEATAVCEEDGTAGCSANFALRLDRIERSPSGPVTVSFTALASAADPPSPLALTITALP